MTDTTKTNDAKAQAPAVKVNKDMPLTSEPRKAAAIPDSQTLGDRFGHVPAPKGSQPKGTGSIPAVDNTTLTQVPHPDTQGGMGVNPNAEPFGREMNHPGVAPGTNFVRDPQVYPTDTTFPTAPLSKESVGQKT